MVGFILTVEETPEGTRPRMEVDGLFPFPEKLDDYSDAQLMLSATLRFMDKELGLEVERIIKKARPV